MYVVIPERQILFLESNYAGNAVPAMRHAETLGFRTHFVARDPEEYAAAAVDPRSVADSVSEVDTYDIGKLLRFAAGQRASAVVAFDDFRVVQAAIVGEQMGVRFGPDFRGLVNVRFKDVMRASLAGSSHHVRHALVDAQARTSPIGYPCVAKPVDESGSVGVVICGDDEEFATALAAVRVGAQRDNIRSFRPSSAVLVEEVLTGPEYSAELVWSDTEDRWLPVGYTRKSTSPPPLCLESGHAFPHTFGSPEADEEILAQLRDVLHRVDLRGVVCHFEFRVDEVGRARVIEVNPRPPGGRIMDLVQAAYGIDLAALHVDAQLGIVTSESVRPSRDRHAAVRFLLPAAAGRIDAITVPAGPDDVDVRIATTPVDVAAVTSNDARLGQVFATGDTAIEVEARLDAAFDRIRTEPPGVLA